MISKEEIILINLIDVKKEYILNHSSVINALNGVTFTLPEQGMVFFVGKSGSGKSTLLNLLGGLDRPTSGTIGFNGKQISSFSNRELDIYRSKHVGFIFQDLNLIETLSVKENIALSLELNGISSSTNQIEEVLSIVDLEGFSNRMPNTLSGGQRQRVAIARALIKSPDIILADEPTGSLDSETSLHIFKLLKHLSQSNLVIVVSHDLEYAKEFGDRIIELKDGFIMSDSNPLNDHNEMIQKGNQEEQRHSFTHHTLPTKRSIQLAYHYLKLKKWKLWLTMVVALSTFILFGLFDALGSYEVTKNSVESMYNLNQKNVFINKLFKKNSSDEYATFIHMSFDDLDELKDRYPDSLFIPVIREFNVNYDDTLYDYQSIDTNLFLTESVGAIPISLESIERLDFDLVYGNLPAQNDQILISLHTFNMYKSYDYRTQDDTKIDVVDYIDMIGLNLYQEDRIFEIVGIIDTHLDLSKFDRLFDGTSLNTIERLTLLYEYKGYMDSGLHQYLFMHEDMMNEHIDTFDQVFDLSLASTHTTMSFQTSSDLVEPYMLGYIANLSSSNQPNSIVWIDEEMTTLSGHQIILPSYAITRNSSHAQEISVIFNQLIDSFVTDHYHEVETEFEANEVGTYQDFVKTAHQNPYHPGFTMYYFYHEALKAWINNHYSVSQDGQMSITGHFDQTHEIEIVGFYDDILTNNQYAAYTSKAFYEEIIDTNHFYPLYGVIAILSGNTRDDHSLIQEMIHQDDEFYYIGTNPILTTAIIYYQVLGDFTSILLYIGIILVCVSTLQLFNLITSSIAMKKHEIGILRAMGARILDVMKIFYSEASIIGLLSAVCAVLLNMIMITGANQFFMTQYGTPVKLLIFDHRQVLIIFGLVLLSTTLSTIFPIYLYARKNPIDTIRLS